MRAYAHRRKVITHVLGMCGHAGMAVPLVAAEVAAVVGATVVDRPGIVDAAITLETSPVDERIALMRRAGIAVLSALLVACGNGQVLPMPASRNRRRIHLSTFRDRGTPGISEADMRVLEPFTAISTRWSIAV